jgi:hypothetical protein
MKKYLTLALLIPFLTHAAPPALDISSIPVFDKSDCYSKGVIAEAASLPTTGGDTKIRIRSLANSIMFSEPVLHAQHWHTFVGHCDVTEQVTTLNPKATASQGVKPKTHSSSSIGGIIDAFSGWFPLVETPDSKAVPFIASLAYYSAGADIKALNKGNPTILQNMPNGIFLATGNGGVDEVTMLRDYASFCQPKTGGGQYLAGKAKWPNCSPGDDMTIAIPMPNCLKDSGIVNPVTGAHLPLIDSDDHFSHSTFSIQWPDVVQAPYFKMPNNCPSTHPIRIPMVKLFNRYRMPAGVYGATLHNDGGVEHHARYWGWYMTKTWDKVFKECLVGIDGDPNNRGLDCGVGEIGLSGFVMD